MFLVTPEVMDDWRPVLNNKEQVLNMGKKNLEVDRTYRMNETVL